MSATTQEFSQNSATLSTEREPLRVKDLRRLLDVVQQLSYLRDLQGVMEVVRAAARDLTQADGVTFVLREGEMVFYADENAIAPLWKGRRFPASQCISGWAIEHRQSVVIEDIYEDARIPHEAYRPTFVRSLAMVPIRVQDPIGAIGAYWAQRRMPTAREVELLEALAGTTSVALQNTELYREAQRAVEVRDEFIRIASHELRTPLTPLKLQIQSMQRAMRAGRSAANPEDLDKLGIHVQRLEQLVDNLLDISAVTSGDLHIVPRTTDLSEVAQAVRDRYLPQAQRARIDLSVRSPGPILGQWDESRLQQAVGNVLSNAIKFAPGAPVRVVVEEKGGSAVLTVRDEGPGISPENQARLFERFERAASVRHYGGFGLGLWLTRRIVAAMGGSISLASSRGNGTTVVIELPKAAREESP